MKLKTTAQMKSSGEAMVFQMEEDWAEMEYGGRTVTFASPLRIKGSCVFDGEGFTVKGRADTLLSSECAKCTKTFNESFSFPFEERFEREGSEDDGIYAYQGDELDLETMIRDNILLNLPISSVCSEDCKGLCPVCGCDRNIVQCDCVIAEEENENPLSALRVLLNEDKEV